jgi:tungstate transport system permease protein
MDSSYSRPIQKSGVQQINRKQHHQHKLGGKSNLFEVAVVEIAGRSLQVTLSALSISALLGIPAGVWLAFAHFPGKRIAMILIYTGMGLPPVLVGLVVYLLLSRSGLLGSLGWLFSVQAMILAQVIIALPLVVGITMSSVLGVDPALRPQLQTLGATEWQVRRTLLIEARFGVLVGLVAGFGSILSEVGAVMIVGGNIEGRTRVLTGAIVLETNRGNFELALVLGAVLLLLSFMTNLLVVLGQGKLGTSP